MNAEQTVEYSLTVWGSIHHCRAQVLDYLFLTIGTGFEWEDGELVSGIEDSRTPEEKAETEAILKESSDKAREYYTTHPYRSWYDWCRYSHIGNIPDDIKPDWAALAIEFLELYIADPGGRMRKSTRMVDGKWVPVDIELIIERDKAQVILADLQGRC